MRRACHARGLRYRVDRAPLQGLRRRADLVFPTERVCVFVDGCYWHGCPIHYVASKSNASYWSTKIQQNRDRDGETDNALISAGWLIVRAWEHEDPEAVADSVYAAVQLRRASAYPSGTKVFRASAHERD